MLDDNLRASRQTAHDRPELKISFEFFPPKTDVMEEKFWDTVHKLAPLKPRFVSVTYGAGGSTRERTLRMVRRIKAETGVDAAAHLTCVGASRAEVDDVVRGYQEAGINRIVAVRGDPPEGVGQPFVPHPEGYRNAIELVQGIRRIGDFDISVSAYPERHPRADRAGHPADPQFPADRQFRRSLRHRHPRLAGRALRRARRRSGNPRLGGGGRSGRAGDRAGGRGRDRIPHLYP